MANPSAAKAAQKSATRRRIVEAAVDLHSTIGPSRTTISAVAERAGVPRLTVYRHFPDQRELELACSALVMEREPLPDPAGWDADDPLDRLRQALRELYRYYARNEGLVANILRDSDLVPSTHEMVEQRLMPGLKRIRDELVRSFDAPDAKRRELTAAIDLAINFCTWRLLVRKRRLSQRAAVELMARLVAASA